MKPAKCVTALGGTLGFPFVVASQHIAGTVPEKIGLYSHRTTFTERRHNHVAGDEFFPFGRRLTHVHNIQQLALFVDDQSETHRLRSKPFGGGI